MNKWMQMAFDEALKGMQHNEGGPFGAVIVKDEKVIARAHNSVLCSKDPTAHAEVNAIRQASKELENFNLRGCTIYVTAKPCPMCMGAIMWARIENVYYGATEEDVAKAGFDDLSFYKRFLKADKGLNIKQIDYKKSVTLFDIWNKKEDKTLY